MFSRWVASEHRLRVCIEIGRIKPDFECSYLEPIDRSQYYRFTFNTQETPLPLTQMDIWPGLAFEMIMHMAAQSESIRISDTVCHCRAISLIRTRSSCDGTNPAGRMLRPAQYSLIVGATKIIGYVSRVLISALRSTMHEASHV